MENIKDIVNNFIDLNTKKYKIIDQMFKLEMGNYNEEEYIKLVEVYSFLDWYIKNELDKYHFKNKEKMADIILVTNPDINTIDPFLK